MPDIVIIIIAGLFLSLFPVSMLFNLLLEKVTNVWLRVILFFTWPLVGILILNNSSPTLPGWILYLSLFTSFLYALRLLTLRDVNQWSGFLATSLWSLLWIPVMQGVASELVYLFAISMTLPLVLLLFLSQGLEKRFGAAFTDLYGGLARTIPRYAGVLVIVIIASIATPLFPTFFIMMDMVIELVATKPVAAVVLLLIWLLWSWAGARIIQGLIVGRKSRVHIADMDNVTILIFSLVLILLLGTGVYLGGVIL